MGTLYILRVSKGVTRFDSLSTSGTFLNPLSPRKLTNEINYSRYYYAVLSIYEVFNIFLVLDCHIIENDLYEFLKMARSVIIFQVFRANTAQTEY